jgi:hypothetical protein
LRTWQNKRGKWKKRREKQSKPNKKLHKKTAEIKNSASRWKYKPRGRQKKKKPTNKE